MTDVQIKSYERQIAGLSTLLQLERDARNSASLEELTFLVVNESHRLLNYRQAILWRSTGPHTARIEAVSGLAKLERDAPYLQWLQRVIESRLKTESCNGTANLTAADIDEVLRSDWSEWCPPSALWCPFRSPNGDLIGGLWLVREQPWGQTEQDLATGVAEAYAHAWIGLSPRRRIESVTSRVPKPALLLGLAAVLIAVLMIPINQTVLAPVEVVAHTPWLATAPQDGVIKRFHVRPNQPVKTGQPLFSLEDIALRSQFELAKQGLELARAELRQTEQQAFASADRKAEITLRRLGVQQKAHEAAYARKLLERVDVRAAVDGIAIFTDVNNWIGRPVQVGERVLTVADPTRTELGIHLPVDDAIPLKLGARVAAFLNDDPLSSIEARTTYHSYEAELTPSETLAYRLTAELSNDTRRMRIGLKGTAKIFGEKTSLFYYLFRRPLFFLHNLSQF